VIDLSCNIRLRSVHLNLFPCLRFNNYIQFATRALSRIFSEQIEEVVFNIETGPFDATDSGWTDLDALLTSPQFATVKTLRIYDCSLWSDAHIALFATCLPTSHAYGIISFEE
jgi:hypothetical protein